MTTMPLTVLVFTVLFSLTTAAPTKPKFLPAFTVSINYTVQNSLLGSGFMAYNLTAQRMLINVSKIEQYTGLPVQTLEYFNGSQVFIDHNGNCKQDGEAAFYSPFDWVRSNNTQFAGNTTYNDRFCNIWNLTTVDGVNLTLCATADGKPVFFNLRRQRYPEFQAFYFENDLKPIVEYYTVPTICGLEHLCVRGAVKTQNLYIFHPKNMEDMLENQDVADVLGEVLFVCHDVLSNNTVYDKYSMVSQYQMELLTNWGLYQECNGYPGDCLGGDFAPVGHEASFAVTPNAGQCNDNTAYGNWYSLGRAGMCQSATEPMSLKTNCTWRILERVKTIDARCLLNDRGMYNSCFQERTVPMATTRNIFELAFASDDPSKGGCPDAT